MSDCKLHHNNQPIFVTFDIEHISLISHIICRWKIDSDIRQILPLRIFCNVIPSFERCLCVRMSLFLIELDQFPM